MALKMYAVLMNFIHPSGCVKKKYLHTLLEPISVLDDLRDVTQAGGCETRPGPLGQNETS